MKGLAFAQQAEIEFIARVSLHALRQHTNRHAVDQVKEAKTEVTADDQQCSGCQRGDARATDHCIKGAPDQYRGETLERSHADRSEQKGDQQHAVAHDVRSQPTERRPIIILIFIGNRKFTTAHWRIPSALRRMYRQTGRT